ncbi:putative ATP-dependent RNA helicase HAS1 [Giardia muris]|uniref:ATP-dependent RNA helicase n=1 Tax=Giardia muris TaxID=5742 RepID=A0A4Z1T6J8_GIAMU|nr:putative ATP-dependent RNA helicase HAS1 [Giardia muris]|eukprot:TNJ28101.1 putative ATP-dependent RNA helicase HAS1 [Giardia muris]
MVDEQAQTQNAEYAEIMTTTPFTETTLSPFLIEALRQMGHTTMTKVQAKAIPLILMGKNVAAKAHTGSGKSLAFLLPAIDLIHKAGMRNRHGTGVLIITPTRELALQLYHVAAKLVEATNIEIGLSIGGTSRQKEANVLTRGACLLIATPGRLCDHLANTPGFKTDRLFLVVFDEADMLMDMGFADELSNIMRLLPGPDDRTACFFSATMSDRCVDVPHVRVNKDTLEHIDVDSEAKSATREGFEQGYIICPPEQRFLLLYTFIKRRANKKIIVFFNSRDSVEFYCEFLRHIGMKSVLMLEGGMKQSHRTQTYNEFANAQFGVLFATNVAARGLDLPDIDFVIQYDPPESVESYVHRVGRACRGANGRKGMGILFLLENEGRFINFLREQAITLFEFEFPSSKIINVQEEMENIVGTVYYLRRKAQDAYKSFLAAYASHPLKKVFNPNRLDLEMLGRSFGLREVPYVPFAGCKPFRREN